MTRVDDKDVVESFLLKTNNILKSRTFNIHKNFYFQRKRINYIKSNKYTNDSTLVELEYNAQDIVNEIKLLKVSNYKETVIDNQVDKVNPFYCFIKNIKGRQVYIKFKISEVKNSQVFCVSFHFAEFYVDEKKLPYRD